MERTDPITPGGTPLVYGTLTPYYERILSYPDFYPTLGRHIVRMLAELAPAASIILEVGAGTCPMHGLGLYPPRRKVIYSDLSFRMLAHAPAPNPPNRVAADVLALPFKGPFDACIMLLDGINYLLSEREIARALGEVFRLLKSGGVFILNTASEAHCRGPLNGISSKGSLPGCDYTLKCDFDPPKRQFRTAFTFLIEQADGTWAKKEEVHVQRIYDEATIRRLASDAGYGLEGYSLGLEWGSPDPASSQIHYGLRKPMPSRS